MGASVYMSNNFDGLLADEYSNYSGSVAAGNRRERERTRQRTRASVGASRSLVTRAACKTQVGAKLFAVIVLCCVWNARTTHS